jgi:hypothetical protein
MKNTTFQELYEASIEEYGPDNYVDEDSYILGIKHAVLFFASILAEKELDESHHEKAVERDPDAWKDAWVAPYWERNRDRYLDAILMGQPSLFEAIPATKEAAATCEELAAAVNAKTRRHILSAEQVRKRCLSLLELGLIRQGWREQEGRGGNPWTFWRAPFPSGFDKAAIEALSQAQEDYIRTC